MKKAPATAICAACQMEWGIWPLPGHSHDSCRRHALEFLRELLSSAGARYQLILARIAAIEAMPDSDFPPDLQEQGLRRVNEFQTAA